MFTDTHAYFFMKKVCDKFLCSQITSEYKEFILDNCFKLELPAIEHHELRSLQTLCWLPGE